MTAVLIPIVTGMYGTLAGTQDLLGPTITLSATSPVTSADATEILTALAVVMDMRLAAAGYTVPVTASDALVTLGWCADRLAAADVLERLMVSTSPDRVSTAQVWRKEASGLLALIYSGEVVLTGAAYTGGVWASSLPTVTSKASVLPDYGFDVNYGGM